MNYFFIFDDREFGEHNEWYIIESDKFVTNKHNETTIWLDFKIIDCCDCFKKFMTSKAFQSWYTGTLELAGHTFSAYKYNNMDILVRKHFTDML